MYGEDAYRPLMSLSVSPHTADGKSYCVFIKDTYIFTKIQIRERAQKSNHVPHPCICRKRGNFANKTQVRHETLASDPPKCLKQPSHISKSVVGHRHLGTHHLESPL